MHRKPVQRPYKLTVGAPEENQMYCTVYISRTSNISIERKKMSLENFQWISNVGAEKIKYGSGKSQTSVLRNSNGKSNWASGNYDRPWRRTRNPDAPD